MIELSMVLNGEEPIQAFLRDYYKTLDRSLTNALRRGLTRIATATKNQIRTESGIGRTIWGKKPGNLTKQVYRMKITKRGDDLQSGIKLKGLPALVEAGGQIKPHEIKPKNRPFLAFRGEKGWVFTKDPVHHPGATVRAHGFGKAAAQREAPAILADMNAEIDALHGKAFG
jgi:hypothetical protein